MQKFNHGYQKQPECYYSFQDNQNDTVFNKTASYGEKHTTQVIPLPTFPHGELQLIKNQYVDNKVRYER